MRRIPPPDINQLALELGAYNPGGGTGDVTQAEFDALQLQVNNLSDEVDNLNLVTADLQDQINNINPGGSGLSGIGRQYFTLTLENINNKFITLAEIPLVSAEVDLYVYEGINQQAGIDFIVTGNVLSWDGLALELLVSVGSRIFVTYGV